MVSLIILAVENDEDMDNIDISKRMTRVEDDCQTTAASARKNKKSYNSEYSLKSYNSNKKKEWKRNQQ